jgi:monothiol glutaredoxin
MKRASVIGRADRVDRKVPKPVEYKPEKFTQVCAKESSMDTQQLIKEQVSGHPVVLYMKGTPQSPQCGFSANAVAMLDACGVKDAFTVDVLANPEIRQGIKDYANWPTVPQLYVKGEFVGGSDIMGEMYESGELQKLLST